MNQNIVYDEPHYLPVCTGAKGVKLKVYCYVMTYQIITS